MLFNKPEIVGISAWINSKPLTLKELKGKVVLVDFWTYTCVNCIRTLPYIKDWHRKYSKLGLVIIGVSTPEFEFEKELGNVWNAARRFGLKYPIALDNDHATWHSFSNNYWPAKYLFNKDGKLVYTHFGEGNYAETEERIRGLLKDAGKDVSKIKVTVEKEKRISFGVTPETYCGFARNTGIGSGGVCKPDGSCAYIDKGNHERDIVYLDGEWNQKEEFVETISDKPASITIKYYGSEINLVIRPSAKPAAAKVFVNGKLKGALKVGEPRMYNLHRTQKAEENELRLEFAARGVRCYAYTFG